MRSYLRLYPYWVRVTALILVAAQVALTLCYLGYSRGLPGFRQFNMDGENNVPTWWSSFILISTGMLCLTLWQSSKRIGRPHVPWLAVGIGFFGLSMEEVASIHEDIGSSVGGGADNVSIWPLLYTPVVIVGVWMMVRVIRDLPPAIAVTALTGLVAYIGVLGVEVASLFSESNTSIAIEENLEMLGTGLMLCAIAAEATMRFMAAFPTASLPPEPAELVDARR
jgi:peptidoglycan/LPS O-acetylase OafA/YrhL